MYYKIFNVPKYIFKTKDIFKYFWKLFINNLFLEPRDNYITTADLVSYIVHRIKKLEMPYKKITWK